MYEQKLNFLIRNTEALRIINYEEVPGRCYCRFGADGHVNLTVYTRSEDGRYIIAEGDSDHTVFMLLKVIKTNAGVLETEYINDATNPMDEMYSRLSCVYWYDEYGFCKLEFFNMESMPRNDERIRRIYYHKK